MGAGLLAVLALLEMHTVAKGEVITNFTQAVFQNALNKGDTITFLASSSLTLTSALQITTNVFIDGSNLSITISGGNAVRLFNVASNTTLIIAKLSLVDGKSTNGAGIFNSGGNVFLTNCVLSGHAASGTNGVNGNNGSSGNDGRNGTSGTTGMGGAIYNLAGTNVLVNCTISSNVATGGNGGNAGNGGDGSQFGGNGGNGGGGAAARGGAIYNSGTVLIFNSSIINNHAFGGDGGSGGGGGAGSFPGLPGSGGTGSIGQGGGIYNLGVVTITNSTFFTNTVEGGLTQHAGANSDGKSGGAGNGGGIYNLGEVLIDTSTFNQNASLGGKGGDVYSSEVLKGGSGGSGSGGAIYNSNSVTIISSTFATNNATGGPGGVNAAFPANNGSTGQTLGGNTYRLSGTVFLRNTILAKGLSGPSCSGGVTDGGYNICSDSSCNFTATFKSRNSLNPQLAAIANNGGLTRTMALLTTSPAVDMGDPGICGGFDQRGVERPQGTNCDVGAFELIPTFSISGRITEGTNGVAGITVTAGSRSGVSATNGYYSIFSLLTSNYVVTPTSIGAGFNPSNQIVFVGTNAENPVAGLSVTNVNFSANPVAINSSITYLTTNQVASNRVILLQFAAMPLRTYKIQSSTNLTNWINISTNLSTSNASFQFTTNLNLPKRFFRSVAP